jgi:hypothetical protein
MTMKQGAKHDGGARVGDTPRNHEHRADEALWIDIDRRLAMLLDFLSAVRIDLTLGETPRGLVSANERLKLTATQLDAAIRTTRDILNKVDTRSGAEAAIFNDTRGHGAPAGRRHGAHATAKVHAKQHDH